MGCEEFSRESHTNVNRITAADAAAGRADCVWGMARKAVGESTRGTWKHGGFQKQQSGGRIGKDNFAQPGLLW